MGGLSLGKTEDQTVEFLAGTRDLDIEGSKSWEAKHRELFTKQYPYIKKVADSYLFPMANLLQVSLDVPTSPPAVETGCPTAAVTDDTTSKSQPPVQENVEDVPFGTTT
ncbi:hypothetical protein Tco_1505557 [Tanacetum coccineum]